MLTFEIAKEIWSYDANTGYFHWKINPKYNVLIGSRAGYFDGQYWRLRYKRKQYKASRVAWLYMTGNWPKYQIDHINLNKLDDSFGNLREATPSENRMNVPAKVTNKLGVKGVHKFGNSYRAHLTIDGKNRRLGCFKSLEEAKSAYDAAAVKLYGEFARA